VQWISPGAIKGVLVLAVVSAGLGVCLHFSGGYITTYESLGGVIVLLLSLYFAGIALLSGGDLNNALEPTSKNSGLDHTADSHS
jgi:membrane protein